MPGTNGVKFVCFGNTDGPVYVASGSWSSVGKPKLVIPPSQIFDRPNAYVRTLGVARGPSGNYYAVLRVGDGYPTTVGYKPAWATSSEGINWVYHGKFQIDGTEPFAFSGSCSILVQEEKPAVLDPANPANNRYLVWEDGYCSGGPPCHPRIALIYSADGADWRFYRDASGNIVDVYPNEASVASDTPVFPTTARTAFGYHMIVGEKFPVDHQRHLWSCDGLKWRVLEVDAGPSETNSGLKGEHLVYESSTGILHTSVPRGNAAVHWTTQAVAYPCPP